MTIQLVINMVTRSLSIHSESVGWLCEDPRNPRIERDIERFKTPAKAMMNGFRLLVAPQPTVEGGLRCWDWWLTKDVDD